MESSGRKSFLAKAQRIAKEEKVRKGGGMEENGIDRVVVDVASSVKWIHNFAILCALARGGIYI